MRIKQLYLENIRSYTQETISFPDGIVLLSGDIGAGKSSLLHAIEFAVFGFERGGASQLLRHGEQKGKVVLTIEVNGKNLKIERSLHRGKQSITQQVAKLTCDDVEEELSATELTTRTLDVLGYPEYAKQSDALLLFRYTVYTSQERMKDILFDDVQTRLQTLRALFGIDKYKHIMANATILLKDLRSQVRAQTEQLIETPQVETQIAQLTSEDAQLQTRKVQNHSVVEKSVQDEKSAKATLDNAQKTLDELKDYNAKQEITKAQKDALQNQLNNLSQTIKETQLQIQQTTTLMQSQTVVDIAATQQRYDMAIKTLHEKKESRALMLEKKASLQTQATQLTTELSELRKSIISISDEQISTFEKQQTKLPQLQAEKSDTFVAIESLTKKLHAIQARVSHAKDAVNKLCDDTCPLCKQTVSQLNITEDYEKQIKQDEQALIAGQTQKSVLQQKQVDIEKQLQESQTASIQLAKITEQKKAEVEKQMRITKLEEKIKTTQGELTSIVIPDISQEQNAVAQTTLALTQARDILEKQQQLTAKLTQLSTQKDRDTKELPRLESQISQIVVGQIKDIVTQTQTLADARSTFEQCRQQAQNAIIEQTKLVAQQSNVTQQLAMLTARLTTLTALAKKVKRKQTASEWIKSTFIPLMGQVEKALFARVYLECNGHFRKWFSDLCEDDMLQARLDAQFTPIISQNGYETQFENLSGGEKTCVALAYRLALNKVVNDIAKDIKTKDILILDEPTDGFSTEQLDRVRDVLLQLNTSQLIMVSHEPKIETFADHIVRIEKNNHITQTS